MEILVIGAPDAFLLFGRLFMKIEIKIAKLRISLTQLSLVRDSIIFNSPLDPDRLPVRKSIQKISRTKLLVQR